MPDNIDMMRQKMLYSFLSSRDGWTPMADVAYRLREHYPGYGWRSNFHNSAVRRTITADIEAINSSPDFPMIVISGNKGIKLATEDEYAAFVAAESKEILRKFKRLRQIIRKANKNLQINLEGLAVSAFADGDTDG